MSKPAKNFILCVHAHQPVGNFGHVFLEAYEKCYRPFFEVLEKHPAVRIVCHFSGSLLDWLEAEKPEFIARLKDLSKRGQIEFLGGGYYEPVYGAIPRQDLEGQIRKMREKIQSLFGQDPRGAWLTERVWDPDLVKPLESAGVAYTIVDDFHFEKAGIAAPVTGYYRAEDDGASVDIFAGAKELRYLMPFRPPADAIRFVRSIRGQGAEDIVVFADDIEKFGLWPGTNQWVYGNGWLEKFFTLLEKEKNVSLETFESLRKRVGSQGVVSLPHASYGEMMEWSGGSFYNFFDKYSESRYMLERMREVSRRLAANTTLNGHSAAAHEALYKAQCNCAYWHGVFGGLYLHHLRSAVFENLIQAEKLTSGSELNGHPVLTAEKLDSGDRWKLEQKNIVSFFNPAYGAALEEIDFKPKSVNLICTLQRRPELYHQTLLKKNGAAAPTGVLSIHQMLGSKERGLESRLFYDLTRRLSFMDRFFQSEIGLESFKTGAYRDAGDFSTKAYRREVLAEENGLSFQRNGFLSLGGGPKPFSITKTFSAAGPSGLETRYLLKNMGADPLDFIFGVEFNFSIGDTEAAAGLSRSLGREWIFNDSWRGIRVKLTSSEDCGLLAAGVETVSESECGMERTYQGLSALLQRRIRLEAGAEAVQMFGLEIGDGAANAR